ncbi:hypothetical protein [Methanoplanus limicola]|uniref:Uncharacterized protein n=1 Tax=Methanoplanus limicola DSM 2279 TaxID=937775 RepID=H1Z424_9EURY|nr:hypothetical protein [Methanoplanus limicola]EHQ35703.1 hypothetical protein Metlim_1602 [Methanoplanus limicola DSM 2279]
MRFRYFELLILLTFCIAGVSAGTGADDIKYSIYPVSGGEDEYEITVTGSNDFLSALAVCFPGNFELIRSGMPDDMYRITGNSLLITLPGDEIFSFNVKCPDICDNPVTVIVEDIENSRAFTAIYDKSGNCMSGDNSNFVNDINSDKPAEAEKSPLNISLLSFLIIPGLIAFIVRRGGK